MKYRVNKTTINFDINQETIGDEQLDYNHKDLIKDSQSWYKAGYNVLKVPVEFIKQIRNETLAYLKKIAKSQSLGQLTQIKNYHQLISSDVDHLNFISAVGKHIRPELLGLDQNTLAEIVKKVCGLDSTLGINCKNLCDIRLFRPYNSNKMDNNPLHRDTWLPVLNNCVNIYIPIAGSDDKSSLVLIPGSHLWSRSVVSRTKENAKIKGTQYGLPSIAAIKTDYEAIRPHMEEDEILIFSSNIIHGGSVNLNSDITRCSIEIRFWED